MNAALRRGPGCFRVDLKAHGWVAHAVFVISSGVAGLAIVPPDACWVTLKNGWRRRKTPSSGWLFP